MLPAARGHLSCLDAVPMAPAVPRQVLSGPEILARAEAVLDADVAACELTGIEAKLPVGVRPRQLSPRTLVLGMLLSRAEGHPAHLSSVHEMLLSLPEGDRWRLGVVVTWKCDPHGLSYRQDRVHRAPRLPRARQRRPRRPAHRGTPVTPRLPSSCATSPSQTRSASARRRGATASGGRPPATDPQARTTITELVAAANAPRSRRRHSHARTIPRSRRTPTTLQQLSTLGEACETQPPATTRREAG